jgi:ABC-type nitrate/sulfonate/bicarbonate transport system permease component
VIILGILVLGILGVLLNKLILAVDGAIVHWRGVE